MNNNDLRHKLAGFANQSHSADNSRFIPSAQGSLPTLHLKGNPVQRASEAGLFWKPILTSILGGIREDILSDYELPKFLQGGVLDTILAKISNCLPKPCLAECQALAEKAGVSAHEVALLSVLGDSHALGCSTVVAAPPQTANGGLLFGRNLDFLNFGLADRVGLIVVHHPEPDSAEIPSAWVGMSGLWGAYTGWNKAGLSLGNMQSENSNSCVPELRQLVESFSSFSAASVLKLPRQILLISKALANRVPTAWAYTQILRNCQTVQAAVEMLRGLRPWSATNLMLADSTGDAALVEWSQDQLAIRRPDHGVLFATNHFRTPELRADLPWCDRYDTMTNWQMWNTHSIDSENIKNLLNSVNQGDMTLHSVIFEPVARRLHITLGSLPATQGPWTEIPWDLWGQ